MKATLRCLLYFTSIETSARVRAFSYSSETALEKYNTLFFPAPFKPAGKICCVVERKHR